jgi:glycosyltransferase involved in cell wall biosynthesis
MLSNQNKGIGIKVMILTNSKSIGGAERAMNILADELQQEKFTVVLIPINSSEEDLVKPRVETWSPERKWQSGLLETLKTIARVSKFAKDWNPDVIILNCDVAEFCGTFLQLQTPKIVVEHTTNPWNTRKTLGRIIRNLLARQGCTFVAVSGHIKIWPWGVSPNIVINNLVTPPSQVKSRVKSQNLESLVFIGRLSVEKGPLRAIEIAKLSGLSIRFFGDGPLREEIDKKAKSENIDVLLEGFVPSVWDHIGSREILVVPSEWEGDGLVVLEAISNRVPILISDIPAFRQFGLMENHYCSDIDDFVSKVKANIQDVSKLIVEDDLRKTTLESRDSSKILDAWKQAIVGSVASRNA